MSRPSLSGLPFLLRRPDTGKYAYWRILPLELVPYFHGELDLPWAAETRKFDAPAVVKISLKTGDEQTARARWGHIHAQVETLCSAAICTIKENAKNDTALSRLKKVSALSGEEISTIALQTRHDVLSANDQTWVNPEAMTPVESIITQLLKGHRRPNSRPVHDRARSVAKALEKKLVETALETRNLGILDVDLVMRPAKAMEGAFGVVKAAEGNTPIPGELTRRLQENGLELPKDSPDRRLLGLAVLRAKSVAMRDVETRNTGIEVETPMRPARIVAPENSATTKHKTLSQMHEIWTKLETPAKKTVDDNKLYVDRFINLHGDMEVKQITRAHVRDFRDILCQLPRNTPKHLSSTSLNELVAFAAANPKQPLLSRRTVNAKGIDAISKLINKAISNDHAEANPCTLLRLTIKNADKTMRLPYDEGDLNRLFTSPVFSDPKFRPAGGGKEAAFWLPLLAMFSGARLEELGQLHTNDIKHWSSIDYIDITAIASPDEMDDLDGEPLAEKNLKTSSSKRMVPIHHQLISLGFLQYVADRRKRRGQMLFPDLQLYRGRYTKNWSRWWGRYQGKHVSKSPAKVFHSFRHGFKDAMTEAEISKEYMKVFLGHAGEDVTDHYGIGPKLRSRNLVLQKMEYEDVDFSLIKSPYLAGSK